MVLDHEKSSDAVVEGEIGDDRHREELDKMGVKSQC
jgi:hypothetical protein